MNTAIFRSLIWQFKMISILIGIILLSLITSHVFYILFVGTQFLLAINIITLMVSFLWVVFALIDALSENEVLSKLDFFYHVIGGVLLIIGAIVWLIVTVQVGRCKGGCNLVQNVFAAIIAILDGVLYIFIGFWLFRSSTSTTQ